jgi:hypothetical protein
MIAFVTLVASLAACSTDFCKSSVTIPQSKLGNCDTSQLNPMPVNGVMTLVSFPDAGACEQIQQQTCDDAEISNINSQIDCLNKAVHSLPDCMHGAENVWPANWLSSQCPSGFANNACTQALGL